MIRISYAANSNRKRKTAGKEVAVFHFYRYHCSFRGRVSWSYIYFRRFFFHSSIFA